MGNVLKLPESQSHCEENLISNMNDKFVSVNKFKFMSPFVDDSLNGLHFNNIYLPEEVICDILSYVPPKEILKLTLVCKKWCNIMKSQIFWIKIYNRYYPKKAKKLPWYVYYCYFTTDNFLNLLKNGNGQERYKYWKIMKNYGNKFKIENIPCGSDPLPSGVPDFNGCKSCFATSYQSCNKIQIISLKNKRLLRYIIYHYMPHIYASEWVAGRHDCGCRYKLVFEGFGDDFDENYWKHRREEEIEFNPHFHLTHTFQVEQWQGRAWQKAELYVNTYPLGLTVLIFEHEGCDTQFWAGHYGSKMAGGVVRFIFDSIQPFEEDSEDDTS